MFPVTFEEFLKATHSRLFHFYEEITLSEVVDGLIHKGLLEAWYLYLAIG
jgi:hypothetical protein